MMEGITKSALCQQRKKGQRRSARALAYPSIEMIYILQRTKIKYMFRGKKLQRRTIKDEKRR